MSEHPYRIDEEAPFQFGTLEASGAPLPLQRIDIHARVAGIHAHVMLEQHYKNDREDTLEVVYVFPTPAMGAVSSYTFTVDGVAIRGVLMEREQARATYDAAIAAGQSASTLEEDRPEVMTVRVGNLRPGSTARVRLGIDLLLPLADDCATLRLPLLVGARYVPGEPLGLPPAGDGTGVDTADAPDASRVTPPIAGDTGVRVGVVIDAYGVADVTATHRLDVDRRTDSLRIRIADVIPDRDIVLRFPLAVRDQALFVPDPSGPEGTLVVSVCSELVAAAPPLDVVVLLDRSGSMEGGKLVAARRAAAGIVESLTPRDRVLMIAFDHELDAPLGSDLVHATASHRRRASDFVYGIEARGGTEIAAPLGLASTALRRDPGAPPAGFVDKLLYRRPDRRRAIVLVTDGQVANEDQLVAIADSARAEILAIAIGPAANQGLCHRLAAVTGGGCEAAPSVEQLGSAIERTLRRLLAPALEELDLSIDGASLVAESRTPRVAPRAIAGVPALLAARVRGVPSKVALHGIDPQGRRIARPIDVDTVDAPSLPRVWARMRIRDLEDQMAALPFPGCLQLEEALVDTSLRFGVLSRFTAFVAVDPRKPPEPPGERPTRLVQPVAAEAQLATSRAMTRSGTVRGKLAHLSPEQCRGLPIGPASDVFSLAVVVHELASGRRLFRGEHDMESLMMILEREAPSLPPAFAVLDTILQRALVKDPAKRTPDAIAFARELATLAADRTGFAELASALAPNHELRGPVRARGAAWWIVERANYGTNYTSYRAVYAGPSSTALPDVVVRVPSEYAERVADPLPIAHPNIARVLGVSAYPQHVAVLELVPGVDLRRLSEALARQSTSLTPGQVIAIAQDCAAALAAIHERGAVLREVDPGSFVLATSGRCVLVGHPEAPRGTALPPLPVPLRGLSRFIT